MSEKTKYFSKLLSGSQGTDEERQCAAILYNDSDVQMNDKRLNQIAALTYNLASTQRIFAMLEKAINPNENPWKVIYKALLIIHTILLFGAETAIDKCIDLCKYIYALQDYNSALIKKSFFSGGGTDYGAPVRAMSKTLVEILGKDEHIRKARMQARSGQNSLVPVGEDFMEQTRPSQGIAMAYGQSINSSVGAGHGLENVPGMYDGRPDRYFDDVNDRRNQMTMGNSQITRDKLAPSLLDLVFDGPSHSNANLPPAEYLPALEKQKELERQLAEQQELLRKLQQQQQQQMQYPGQPSPQMNYPPQQMNTMGGLQQPQRANYSNDLLGLDTMASPSYPNVNNSMGGGMMMGSPAYPMPQQQQMQQQPVQGGLSPFTVVGNNMNYPNNNMMMMGNPNMMGGGNMGSTQNNQQFPYANNNSPAMNPSPMMMGPAMNSPYQAAGMNSNNSSAKMMGGTPNMMNPNMSSNFQPIPSAAAPMNHMGNNDRPLPAVPPAIPPPLPSSAPHNETDYLEDFHRAYQSHSIRYTGTHSPIEAPNTVTPNNPVTGYDSTTQLWSFDQSAKNNQSMQGMGAPPPVPPPIPSMPPMNSPPYQQYSMNNNSSMMGGGMPGQPQYGQQHFDAPMAPPPPPPPLPAWKP